jgi:hypothetical protein
MIFKMLKLVARLVFHFLSTLVAAAPSTSKRSRSTFDQENPITRNHISRRRMLFIPEYLPDIPESAARSPPQTIHVCHEACMASTINRCFGFWDILPIGEVSVQNHGVFNPIEHSPAGTYLSLALKILHRQNLLVATLEVNSLLY